ncbi:general substrate transporter [Phyllosticta paracitricarpa]|uniref:General substrate transporter n=1 Tax=Phyllosticta paracitricarpa TaxID=2016321 RepID=A0ABR1MUW5_9PEZI
MDTKNFAPQSLHLPASRGSSFTTIDGTEAFNEAKLKEPPQAFSKPSLILHLCCLVGFFCSTVNGYDGSLLNGLLINDEFKTFFHGSEDGLWAGIVTSIYQIGSVVALPFVGPAIDKYGRKGGMLIGAAIIIVGTVVNATTYWSASIGQFEAGRFILGFGVSIMQTAGPMYVVETTHPAYRGVVTGLYNTFWYVGSMVAAGAVRGAIGEDGKGHWIVPIWLQMLFSGLVMIFAWFLPESPRWLYANGRTDECHRVLTRFHANGNEDSIWVRLQLREYDEYLRLDGSDKRWWDYRGLFRNRASSYRLLCNIIVVVCGQWMGGAVLTYFMSSLLTSAGYKSEVDKANINLAYSCEQFIVAIIGALSVDKLGRRALLLFACIGCSIVWIGLSVATSQYDVRQDAASSKAATAMIFLFGAVFSFGMTPMQVLYPVEVLSFEQRAKGMALSSFAVNAAALLNQFAWPVALKKIGWRTYVIFVVWDAIQGLVIYFFIPETKNRTLEELDDIFSARNPRKESTKKKTVALNGEKTVVMVDES